MRNKYTYLELESFIMDYLREKSTVGHPQRLGQWFVDTKDTSGEPFPELFYEPTIKKSIDLIYQNYLKEEI